MKVISFPYVCLLALFKVEETGQFFSPITCIFFEDISTFAFTQRTPNVCSMLHINLHSTQLAIPFITVYGLYVVFHILILFNGVCNLLSYCFAVYMESLHCLSIQHWSFFFQKRDMKFRLKLSMPHLKWYPYYCLFFFCMMTLICYTM